jgi:hypothetical protein
LYNLFGDKELGLDLVPQSVYDMQSEFYPTVFNEYGVPLDTRHTYTKGEFSSNPCAIFPLMLTEIIQVIGNYFAQLWRAKTRRTNSSQRLLNGLIKRRRITPSPIYTTPLPESK